MDEVMRRFYQFWLRFESRLTKSMLLGFFFVIFLLMSLRIQVELQDFHVFYLAGQRYWNGQSLYQLSDGFEIFKYSPFFAMLMTPLSLMPESLSKCVWLALNLGSLFFLMKLLIESTHLKKHLGVTIFLSLFATSHFLWLHVLYGQVNFIVLLCVMYTMRFIDQKHYFSGVLLSVGTLIKLTPLIVFPYMVWRKNWSGIVVFIVSTILLCGLSLLRFGEPFEILQEWFITMKGGHSLFDPHAYPYNNNLQNFLSALLSYPDLMVHGFHKNIVALPETYIPFIFITLVVCLALIVLLVTEHYRLSFGESWLEVASHMVLAQVVLSPLAWHHNFVNLIVPIFCILAKESQGSSFRFAGSMAIFPFLYGFASHAVSPKQVFLFYWPCLIFAIFVFMWNICQQKTFAESAKKAQKI